MLSPAWTLIAKTNPRDEPPSPAEITDSRSTVQKTVKMLETDKFSPHNGFPQYSTKAFKTRRKCCNSIPRQLYRYSLKHKIIFSTWETARLAQIFKKMAFAEFRKEFDSIPYDILLAKLKQEFGITRPPLDLIKNYLCGRRKFNMLNGVKSELLLVSIGIPPGSLLGWTVLTLFTNDLPSLIFSVLL